jgi:hypothetical protein
MQKKEKAPKRENLYNATIVWPDPDKPGAVCKKTWHRVDADSPATWRRTAQKIKELFPGVTHVNLYGGISETFHRQIKF